MEMKYGIYNLQDFFKLMTKDTETVFRDWLSRRNEMLCEEDAYKLYDEKLDCSEGLRIGYCTYSVSHILKNVDIVMYDSGFSEFMAEDFFEFTFGEQVWYMSRCDFYDLFDEFTDNCCYECSACSKYALAKNTEYISENEHYCEECHG